MFLIIFACDTGNSFPLLWEISGNGLTKPSYILGTNHGMDYLFLDEINGFDKCLNRVDQLICEIDIFELQDNHSQHMTMPDTLSYRNLLGFSDWITLDSITKKYLIRSLDDINISPSSLSLILSMAKNTNHVEYQRDMIEKIKNSMEIYLLKWAKMKQINIANLDDVHSAEYHNTTLINYKLEAEMLVESVLKSDQELLSLELVQEIDSLYKLQNLRELELYLDRIINGVEDQSSASYRYTVETFKNGISRNYKWMEKIPKYIDGCPSLIAVGAYHLVGSDGLITLLKEKGYTVKPIK